MLPKPTYYMVMNPLIILADSGEKLPQALTDQALVLDIDGNFIPDFFVSSATEVCSPLRSLRLLFLFCTALSFCRTPASAASAARSA